MPWRRKKLTFINLRQNLNGRLEVYVTFEILTIINWIYAKAADTLAHFIAKALAAMKLNASWCLISNVTF